MKRFLIVIAVFCIYSSQAQMFSDFSEEELHEDIQFLFSALQKIHPEGDSFYNGYAAQSQSLLTGDIYSESDAFFIINKILKDLNDGHSNVKFSKDRIKAIMKYGAFFPYDLEFFDSTAVIVGHVNEEIELSERKEIFAINNIPIKKIIDELRSIAMVDGEENNSARDWVAQDFWFYYTLFNGFRNSYSVSYLKDGRTYHSIEKATKRSSLENPLKKTKRPLKLHNYQGVPVLTVSNFNTKSKRWWKRQTSAILSDLEKNNEENLILDFRGNGGGKENLQDVILEAFGVSIQDKYAFEGLKEANLSEVSGVKNKQKEFFISKGLEVFHFNQVQNENFRCKKEKCSDHFRASGYSGNVYILIDGTTFSCASDAAALIKENYAKTTLVGTETRGSGKENYAGYFIHVVLPNTELEVRIPRVKYILNTTCSADTGVIPDVKVEMKSSDIQSEKDTQLNFVLKMLKQNQLSVQD